MANGKKVQIVALVEPDVRVGLDTLRMIQAASRARVMESVLAPAVRAQLEEVSADVKRVEKLAKRARMTVEQYTAAYAEAFSGVTYPPGLAALEQDDSMVTSAA
jgi:hypothetical protein